MSQLATAFGPMWRKLLPRERWAVGLGLGVVAAAAFWWLLLAKPLTWLRQVPAMQATADAQLARMQSLAAQAQSIQSAPTISLSDALRALESTAKERLGATAELRVVGDRATLTLKSVSPQALGEFLAAARTQARALPNEASLKRVVPIGGGGLAWEGSIVLVVFAQP